MLSVDSFNGGTAAAIKPGPNLNTVAKSMRAPSIHCFELDSERMQWRHFITIAIAANQIAESIQTKWFHASPCDGAASVSSNTSLIPLAAP